MNGVELRTRVCGDHIVVALSAELDICQAAATIAAIAGRGPGREHCVIVDLQALDFIDCAALRALARAQQQARQAGGQVLLAAPAGTLARVLDLTGLGEALGVHASVASALASALTGARPANGTADIPSTASTWAMTGATNAGTGVMPTANSMQCG